ncbi:MAG TPA: hypothetical protein DCR04_08925 [Flavobacteriales bacterium]|nr:hypothetical protein [Flavobacteriales bacterium]
MFYVLTPDSGQKVILNFIDNDGIGGQPALVNSGILAPNTTYRGELLIGTANTVALAKLEHMADSTSVTGQPELHQVFFEPNNGLELVTSCLDIDKNGNPVGMQTTLTTGSISEGELVISIIHKPNKQVTAVMNGNRTRAGGSIDVEATFQVTIASN